MGLGVVTGAFSGQIRPVQADCPPEFLINDVFTPFSPSLATYLEYEKFDKDSNGDGASGNSVNASVTLSFPQQNYQKFDRAFYVTLPYQFLQVNLNGVPDRQSHLSDAQVGVRVGRSLGLKKGYFLSAGAVLPTGKPNIGTDRPGLNVGAFYFQPLGRKNFGYIGASGRLVFNREAKVSATGIADNTIQYKHGFGMFAGFYRSLSPRLDLTSELETFRSLSPDGEYGVRLRVGPRFIGKSGKFIQVSYRYDFAMEGNPRAVSLSYAVPFR